MNKKKDDGYRMGKKTGYDLLPDGGIKVAPVYNDRMNQIFLEGQSIKNVLEAISDHCTKMFNATNTKKQQLWLDMSDDYGLDISNTAYTFKDGVLIKQVEEKK